MTNEDKGGSNKGSKKYIPDGPLTAAKIDSVIEHAKVDSVSVENVKISSTLDQGKSGKDSSSK